MIEIILFISVVAGVVIALMKLAAGWGGEMIRRDIVARLQAGETIVNWGKMPDEWIEPHRRRVAALREAGESQDTIDRAGQAAQASCLRKIDDLLLFFNKTNLADGPDTKEFLLQALRERRARVAAQSWEILLANQPDPELGTSEAGTFIS